MSTYENYEKTSAVYDKRRLASGFKTIIGILYSELNKPLSELHVLDAGCGTANYSLSLLQQGLGHATLTDASEGMLHVAKTKLHSFIQEGKVDITQGLMPKLNYPDATFDAVMFNLTLHHVQNTADQHGNYPLIAQVIKEAQRVLKPGGVIIYLTVSPIQIQHAYWWIINDKYKTFCTDLLGIPPHQFHQYLHESGFEKISRIIPASETLMNPDTQYDKDGPFKEDWRSGASFYSLLVKVGRLEEYLQDYKQIVKGLDSWDDFVKKAEQTRLHYGQIVIMYALKS